jgi:hypothetical protein
VSLFESMNFDDDFEQNRMPDERYNGCGSRCESDQQGPSETLSNINFSLPEPDTSPRKVVLRQCSLSNL